MFSHSLALGKRQASIVIASVQLGRGGGQSRWSLQTFRSSWEGVLGLTLGVATPW